MIQIAQAYCKDVSEANEKLRIFQKEHPKAEIKNVSFDEVGIGWSMVITVDIKM